MYDYQYVNTANEFNFVKFNLGGDFLIVGDDVDDCDLLKMGNMQDVNGWEIQDI